MLSQYIDTSQFKVALIIPITTWDNIMII